MGSLFIVLTRLDTQGNTALKKSIKKDWPDWAPVTRSTPQAQVCARGAEEKASRKFHR